MPHVQWKERYNINYKDIDAQHQGLIVLLNDLMDLLERQREAEEVSTIFHRLFEYTQVHFATEERYMKKARYVGLLAHKAAHAAFMRRLLELNDAYDPTDPKLLEATLDFLREWYVNHIMRMDMEYVPHMQGLLGKLPVRGVLFDFGNVLSAFDTRRFTARLAETCGADPAALHAAIYERSGLIPQYESGALDSSAFARRLAALCEHPFTDDALAEAYADIFTPTPAVQDLVRRLKPKYRLGLISETGPWHLERAIRTCPVFPLFDAATFSCEVGHLKPSAQLFEDALGKLDLISEECVYIDDREEVVAAARALRFHGIVFRSAEALEVELRRLGLEV